MKQTTAEMGANVECGWRTGADVEVSADEGLLRFGLVEETPMLKDTAVSCWGKGVCNNNKKKTKK